MTVGGGGRRNLGGRQEEEEISGQYQVVEETDKRSLLRIRLLTGRHHQIRVQLAHAGVPIVGDRKYGMREERGQLCLCASEMVFGHPGTGERMGFRVEPAFLENWKG